MMCECVPYKFVYCLHKAFLYGVILLMSIILHRLMLRGKLVSRCHPCTNRTGNTDRLGEATCRKLFFFFFFTWAGGWGGWMKPLNITNTTGILIKTMLFLNVWVYWSILWFFDATPEVPYMVVHLLHPILPLFLLFSTIQLDAFPVKVLPVQVYWVVDKAKSIKAILKVQLITK